MESRRRYKRIGVIFLLALAVLVGSMSWLTYREIRQEKLNHTFIAAVKQDDPVAVQTLLTLGANPNARDRPYAEHLTIADVWHLFWKRDTSDTDKHSPTALLVAVRPDGPNDSILIRVLLEHGADPNVKWEDDWTPLLIEAAYGTADQVKLLLEKGAKVDTRNANGDTALTATLSMGRMDSARLLIEKGANVNIKNDEGETPLMRAGDGGTVMLLLDRGAKIDDKDNQGFTALWEASMVSNYEVARLLLKRGADVNARDKQNKTVLASIQGYNKIQPRMIALLKQAGAHE